MGRRPGSGLEADCFFFPLSSNWPTSATLLLRPVRFRAFAERCLARTVAKGLSLSPFPSVSTILLMEREIESNRAKKHGGINFLPVIIPDSVLLSFLRGFFLLKGQIRQLREFNTTKRQKPNGLDEFAVATVPVDRRCASRNLWSGLALVLRHVCVTHMITVVVTSRHTYAIAPAAHTSTRAASLYAPAHHDNLRARQVHTRK